MNNKIKLKIMETIKDSDIGKTAELYLNKKIYNILLNRLTIKILKLLK